MVGSLTSSQLARYRDKGYLFPLRVFAQSEIDGINSEFDEARIEGAKKNLPGELAQYFRVNAHYLIPFVSRVARTNRLLDMIESILGPNLLLWSAEFFTKEAGSSKIVSWHQDLTYWGLGETDEEITAWIALSDVTVESGCMRFIPGSHHKPILPHLDTFDQDNQLSRGQELVVDIDEEKAVNVILKPGEVSLHHGRIFHASGPNTSEHNRTGLVIRYITPAVRQLVSKRDYAMLVRGIDDSKNWIHVSPPIKNFSECDIGLSDQICKDQSEALAQGADQSVRMYSGL